jgi:hypothetical protein
LSTLQETRKNLKRRGAKKEDIKVALIILDRLQGLDNMVFPENPATINFSIARHRFGYPVAHHPNKNSETRYSIYLDGIADFLKEERRQKSLWIAGNRKGRRLLRPTWEELIIPMAAHEVRHRVQCDCSLKKFSPRSSSLIKDDPLRSIIEFNELELKERYKIYVRESKSKTFIKDRINRKEFDASTIERLVANMIHRKNAYSLREEIASVIKLQAP